MTNDSPVVAMFEPNEAVSWMQTHRGGYGYTSRIPATFLKYTSRGWALIQVTLASDPSQHKIIRVKADNLFKRAKGTQ